VRRFIVSLAVAVVAFCGQEAFAQFDQQPSGKGPRLGEAKRTQKSQVGMIISAVGGPCRGLYGTIPFPIAWPEQEVRVVDEEISPAVKRVRYRMIDGTVKQMLVEIPYLRSGAVAKALITLEIVKKPILPPEDTSIYKLPQRVPRDMRKYLGPSPYIESRHRDIRELAEKLVPEDKNAWETVEAIYDGVREKVEYKNGPLKGALQALRDGSGDCEELSSLFIAVCRAADIPARTVWVPGHCYPEFYLVDGEGNGYWFPCQAAGARAFGEMPDERPILQKGDNFKVPEKPREPQRYVAEFLKGLPVPGGGKPQVQFVRQALD
jgi:hypothetical protein